jgi:hypothetical protein
MSDDEIQPAATDQPQYSPGSSPDAAPLQSLPATIRLRWESVEGAFLRELEAEGGQMWLNSRCPTVARGLESDSSVTAESLPELLRSETKAFWLGVEARLSECARCPKDGAVCAETASPTFKAGAVVRLRIRGEVAQTELKPCERFGEFRMARRMIGLGVDARLARVSRSRLKKPEHIVEALDAFLDKGTLRDPPKGVQLAIVGEFASEYGAALLRSVAERYSNHTLKSVHAPTLLRDVKNSMTVKEESPLKALLEVSVLVIDGVDAYLMSSEAKWFRSELVWLYERRRDQGLASIVTSSVARVGEAFLGASVLKV